MASMAGSGKVISYISSLSLHWEVPIFSVLAYVIWVKKTNRKIREMSKRQEGKAQESTKKGPAGRKAAKKEPAQLSSVRGRSLGLKLLIALHNMAMSVFSMIVFKNTAPIIWRSFRDDSFRDFVVDPTRKLTRSLEFWTWLFYVSKYYEIMDTLILFLSGKESSFLQMYHHAGAIVACWLMCLADSHTSWIFVVLNSFIHSVMYLYYSLTAFGIRPAFKRVITFMQIGQFLVGMVFGFFFITNPDAYSPVRSVRMYQIAAILVNFFYVLLLVVLFLKFEKKTYRTQAVASVGSSVKASRAQKSSAVEVGISSVVSSPSESAVASTA